MLRLLFGTGGWGEPLQPGRGLEGQTRGELEGSRGLVGLGHEGPGLLSLSLVDGNIVGFAKHDATSTGGDIEGLAPSASCIAI